MSKSLAVIVSEASALETMLVESDGEITPDVEAFLAVNAAELQQKVDSYSLIMERLETLAGYYKNRSEFFAQVSKQCESARDRLESNIENAMKVLKTDEIAGQDVRFKLVKSNPSVVIENEKLIPAEYKKEKVTVSIDKKRLGEDLKIGDVTGAKLESKEYLRTYGKTLEAIKGGKK